MKQATALTILESLTQAIVLLTERRALTDDPRELAKIEIELPKLEEKRQRIHQLSIARKLRTIREPSPEDREAMVAAARKLDGISAENTTARAVLSLIRAAAEIVQT